MSENIPSLRGFDLDAALQRLRGRWDILKPVLISFCENNASAYSQFEEYIRSESYVEAARIAHRLKGSGANIGADALSRCAAALETQLKAGDFVLSDAQMHNLKSELDYLKEVKVILSIPDAENSDKESAKVISLADVKAALSEVSENIETDISKSLNVIQQLAGKCKGTAFEKEISTIGTQFNQFKLNDAKTSITNFLSSAK